ncbi:hypothetical protein TRVL_08193 [Trypanosoma vivax]|uniref:Uncharacterized protein n=1 Tax=Trypanosoma vivax (strain Y486) TaxID=1055687 RepID=F9WV23_TRYVY|nr:hypothetical protein TRVL_08193 [Trypanosoma vivax]CCD21424.1 hypothetical protein, conserved in T. vivax [Trypanosoma vivax Y486]|eukprot:CCD21424.1 hypothetical protein, conserved in T. vivax [Trypanosoma vivax Y486]
MCGWGALLFKDSGEVWVAGGAWGRALRFILQGPARAVSLALGSFAEATQKNLRICICIGNAAAMNVMKKGNANCDALVREPSLAGKALQEQGVHASWDYIASAGRPADVSSRGNGLWKVDVAKGWWMRRGGRGLR